MLCLQYDFISHSFLLFFFSRYPFLLQSPDEFSETLQRLNWRTDFDDKDVQRWMWEPSAEDRNGTCPWHFRSSGSSGTSSSSTACQQAWSNTWVNLSELLRRLWLVPERIFQYVTPALPVSALRQAIHLPEQEALAADEDIFSPEVKGVTREDRDKWCTAATNKLSEYLSLCYKKKKGSAEMGVHLEDSIKKVLKNLNWNEDRCVWSKEWWGNETAWVAPWTQRMGESFLDLVSWSVSFILLLFDNTSCSVLQLRSETSLFWAVIISGPCSTWRSMCPS